MKEQRKNNKVWLILLIVLAVIIMYILPIGLGIWTVMSESFHYEEKNNEILINKGNLVINNVIFYYDSEADTYYIEGLLKNNKDKKYEYLNIVFYVYDGNNNILGEATASLSSLEENGTWKFKAKYEENDASNVSSYKFSSIEFF